MLTAAVNGATSVARYTSSGEPDASFGANGITTFPVNENLNFETLTILQDGSIIIAGSNSIYYADHYDVLKFTANGKLIQHSMQAILYRFILRRHKVVLPKKS